MKTFRYRLYPTQEQAGAIRRTAGCVRYVYNGLLNDYKAQYNEWKKNGKPKENAPKLKEVTFLKATAPFLSEVDSLALANSKLNLKAAFKNFFDSCSGKRKGAKMKFPKPHKKGKSKAIYKTNNQSNSIRIEGDTIRLPKIGNVKVHFHRPYVGAIRSVCVEAAKNDRFYVVILTDCPSETIRNEVSLDNLNIVGLDMSYSKFCVDSDCTEDDTKPKYVRWYRTAERKRKRLARRLSIKEKASSNREKARRRLASFDAHTANRRKDFCHKMSHHYATHYDVIVLEDISMQDLAKRHMKGHGKSVCDLGFGMFKQFLSYKCQRFDTLLVYADKWFPSSKTCNHCGEKNSLLKLNDREWVCPHCGAVIDRDYNAACNLRDYFVKIINTAGTAGIYACGDDASTLRSRAEQALSAKQETPSFRWG